ncbi:prepilin peptidase, partial [uncultured Campylobacter sp.]|uniref:prepilin peptidase n=1 Tax=uncultured Campylobacter sp. TaxID=218934 RepID=UPI00260AFE7E
MDILVIFFAVFAFVFGICVGSFSNVLIYRLPRNESINFPASHCPKCSHKLNFYHNIPLFSWLFLGGKCAFCKQKINLIYPLVELASGLLF